MIKLNFTVIGFSCILLFACTPPAAKQTSTNENIVEVIAKDYTFELPVSILSGWTTFRLHNTGHCEHFFLLNILPDSISYPRYIQSVTRPFDVVFDSLKAGMSQEKAGALLGSVLPAWYFGGVKQMGGTGIVSPMKTAQTTVKLLPGNYVMECYIKEKGQFHTALGMIRPLEVVKDSSEMQPPQANVQMQLTNTSITISGDIHEGENTISVTFLEHPQYELGNDIHVIRIGADTDMENVISWLNWMNIKGLESPAPAEFLGGTQEMPVGYTSYFTVDLSPGSYAWIAESGAYRGLVEKFDVERNTN